MKKKYSKRSLAILCVSTVFVIIIGLLLSTQKTDSTTKDPSGLAIKKSDVKGTAKFYPYKVNGIYMEVIAVKASDGTVRTALNTCQVCFDSGRGYYTQSGNELVCNNCGNRFKIDQIEKIRFGCNPIPIMKEDKTEENDIVTISAKFLNDSKDYFKRWKR